MTKITKMNPEVKTLWVAALRDPENKQISGVLRDKTGFCCLGLLTELFRKSEANTKNTQWAAWDGRSITFDGCVGYLPDSVCNWGGIKSGARVIHDERIRFLYYLNDSEELTFPQIADLIEAQL